ncbi:hypothetical protein SLA2020_053640 [Shorea laevis]
MLQVMPVTWWRLCCTACLQNHVKMQEIEGQLYVEMFFQHTMQLQKPLLVKPGFGKSKHLPIPSKGIDNYW